MRRQVRGRCTLPGKLAETKESALPQFLLGFTVHGALAAACVYHALLFKRDPRAALAWIMASLFVPYAGPLAYFFFGVNRVRSRAQAIRRPFYAVPYEIPRPRRADWPDIADADAAVSLAGQRISGRPALGGNRVEPLFNGDEAYPAMLEAIATARTRVFFSTYIMRRDDAGRRFADAFEEAHARGVDVRVLVDGIGELYSFPGITSWLQSRGVRVARFLPPHVLPPSLYVNLRNHRKILIADDEVAFTGGINVGDDNLDSGIGQRHVTDLHFRVQGPAVTALGEVFLDDWHFATRERRRHDDESSATAELADLRRDEPRAANEGEAVCRVLADGPDVNLDVIALAMLTAFSRASRRIDIMTPYFVPGREMVAALVTAALRGVRVRIVLPVVNNLPLVHWANRNVLAELLNWQVEVYYQPAPFCHSKLTCVDEDYALIGSANVDPRSLRLNFEIGMEVFSGALCDALAAHVDETIARSAPLTFEMLDRRSIPVRLRDSAAALFSPYL